MFKPKINVRQNIENGNIETIVNFELEGKPAESVCVYDEPWTHSAIKELVAEMVEALPLSVKQTSKLIDKKEKEEKAVPIPNEIAELERLCEKSIAVGDCATALKCRENILRLKGLL